MTNAQRHPSLIGRIARAAPHRPLLLCTCAVLAALLAVALVATLRAQRIERQTRALIADAPAPAAAQAEVGAISDAFARPRLATSLAELAIHLPSATPLVAAARTRDGALRIALDTADPDELRALLESDPWFARFREKAQETRAEGRIRVTLVERAS